MFSKRTFSAVDATVVIASQQQGMTVSTQDIAELLGLSVSYLESILKVLKANGIIRSYRGPGGGYTLARPAKDIHVADILRAIGPAQVSIVLSSAASSTTAR